MVFYGSMLVLEVWNFRGPPNPYPSPAVQQHCFSGRHCHSHMQGHTKKDFHTLLVKIETAIPFRKQSGSIYPKSEHHHWLQSSHVPTALSGTESSSRLHCGFRQGLACSGGKERREEFQPWITRKWERKTRCREEHMTSSDFYESMREIISVISDVYYN